MLDVQADKFISKSDNRYPKIQTLLISKVVVLATALISNILIEFSCTSREMLRAIQWRDLTNRQSLENHWNPVRIDDKFQVPIASANVV